MYVSYLKKTLPIKNRFFPAYSFAINRDGVSACVPMPSIKKLGGIQYYSGSIYIDDRWYSAVFREKGDDLYNVGTLKKPIWVTSQTRLFSSFDRKIRDEKYKRNGKLPCPLFAEAKQKNAENSVNQQMDKLVPKMQRNLNTYEYIPMANTRYELHKQNMDNSELGVYIGTDTPCYFATGKVDRFVSKTKKVDYTEKKPVYAGREVSVKIECRPLYGEFNAEDWAWTAFRDSMLALGDEMLR